MQTHTDISKDDCMTFWVLLCVTEALLRNEQALFLGSHF